MDLQQEWQNISAEIIVKDSNAHTTLQLDAQSNSLMQSLLFKLKWKLRWIRIIDLPLLATAFFVQGDLQIILVAMFLTYEIFRAFAIHAFKQIKTGVDYSSNTKKLLQDNIKAVKQILRIENIYGYVFLPLAGPSGLLACRLYVHQSFENVWHLPNFFLQMGLLVFIGIPLIFIAKKMNGSLFNQHLKDLEFKVRALNT